ncbi:hypothetical protein L6164_026815 [Bauhinia variegata]|uniref:Uncharacterized protein n=1 Tax=Bauhinia variegata TaxID=167791 RepID=A0ACB9LS65_BAUVA|nr:hypothetical protein L6164_026815 [Bauhinia variegata]
MGLQNQLHDFSSDSIPLLLIAIIADCVNYLRSSLLAFLHILGLSRFDPNAVVDDGFIRAVGSGFAGLIVLAEQLNLNRRFSYRHTTLDTRDGGADAAIGSSKCIVCLSSLKDGDLVRKLSCRHVFHKHCFDGWLDSLKFNCPLCRLPLVSDERVALTEQRVGEEFVSMFSCR